MRAKSHDRVRVRRRIASRAAGLGRAAGAAPAAAAALALALGSALATPRSAHAGLGIEPYVASRQLTGDAGDLFDGGVAYGAAVSLGLPAMPLRARAGIDFSSHDGGGSSSAPALDGTVLTLDAVLDLGMGLFVPYLVAGLGVSNLDDDPAPGEVAAAYDSGTAFGRAGAGVRAGLGRRLAATGEVTYARGGKGNQLVAGRPGNLAFLDLRVGVVIGL
jgi:hypothetical protein